MAKSVKAVHADTSDVTIDAHIQGNVHAEQTNVAAGGRFVEGFVCLSWRQLERRRISF